MEPMNPTRSYHEDGPWGREFCPWGIPTSAEHSPDQRIYTPSLPSLPKPAAAIRRIHLGERGWGEGDQESMRATTHIERRPANPPVPVAPNCRAITSES